MSKNSPKGPAAQGQPQQPNWLLAVAWAVMLFLLFRMMTGADQKAAAPVQPTDLRSALIKENASLLEVTAARTLSDYNNALKQQEDHWKDEANKKRLDRDSLQLKLAEINQERAEAAVLTADVQLRAGQKLGQYDRYQNAFQTLYTLQQAQGETPNWTQLMVTLPKNPEGPERTITPHDLYENAKAELSNANKRNLVWGFIPGWTIIDTLVKITGAQQGFSYWFAALLLAVLVRSVVWPLSQKQLMFSRQMAQLSPLVKEIQEKYKNDESQKGVKTMELYRQYGINPAAGCFPALVQIPLFFAIYQCMLQYRFDFQNGTFLWTTAAISKATHGFTAPNLGQPDNILIILYAISMMTSTLMMPISDPSTAKQQRLTGIIVALIFPALMFSRAYPLPCAFVLYWIFTNVLTTLQTLRAHRLPAPPLVKVTTPTGGVVPTAPKKKGFMEKMQDMYEAQMAERDRLVDQAKLAKEIDEKNSKSNFDLKPDADKNTKNDQGKKKPKRRA